MRRLEVLVVVGVISVATAALAQESFSIRLLDVPADYQALRPLPTDWPPPVNTFWNRNTRYSLGPTRSNFSPGSEVMRLRGLRDVQLRYENLRNRVPPGATPPTGAAPPAGTPPASAP